MSSSFSELFCLDQDNQWWASPAIKQCLCLFVCLFVCAVHFNSVSELFIAYNFSWYVEMDKHRCNLVGFWDQLRYQKQAAVNGCSSFGYCCHWLIFISSTNMITANCGAFWLHPMERKWRVRSISFCNFLSESNYAYSKMLILFKSSWNIRNSPHTLKVNYSPCCASDLHCNPVVLSSHCLQHILYSMNYISAKRTNQITWALDGTALWPCV